MHKKAYNKVDVSESLKKQIRSLFFRKVEMKKISEETKLTERIIRRVVNEHNWIQKRERYLRFLCSLACLRRFSISKMAKISGVSEFSLGRIHRKYQTQKPKTEAWNKRINNNIEKLFIKEYLGGKTAQYIAEKYGFKTDKTVFDVLVKNAINRRPPKIQTFYKENYFEKIDSSEKAYALGLIMTDGYIIKNYRGFGIQLTKKDGYILDKISKSIGSTNKISLISYEERRKSHPNVKDMMRLIITNEKIAQDLKKLGVTKRKSKTLKYNGCVPKKYLSHFFRGLIDGDGTIGTHSKNGNIWCKLVSSSKNFIYDLYSIVIPFDFYINKSTYFYGSNKEKKCVMYSLCVGGGNHKTKGFLKWLYTDKGDFFLRRKYEKVQNYIN